MWKCTDSALTNGDAQRAGRRSRVARHPGRWARADRLTVVVVHPEGVDRPRDRGEIAWSDDVLESECRDILEHVGGVLGAEERIEEEPVELPVDASNGFEVRVVVRVDRIDDAEVEGDTEAEPGVASAEFADREPMCEQQVMCGGEAGGRFLPPGCVLARHVADER